MACELDEVVARFELLGVAYQMVDFFNKLFT
jgi:hypothetical protein